MSLTRIRRFLCTLVGLDLADRMFARTVNLSAKTLKSLLSHIRAFHYTCCEIQIGSLPQKLIRLSGFRALPASRPNSLGDYRLILAL